jgi:predicted dehydrogenase
MKFALLGVDHDALELIGQLCRAREHELRVAYDVDVEVVRDLAPRVEIGDAPEALLARQDIDAVIVANSPDQKTRELQLRTLVQGGLRLVVMLPMCDSLTAYELEMIRLGTTSIMIPYSSGRGHPAIEQLSDLIRAADQSPIGVVEQIVFERHMADRSRDSVMPQLCRDGHLMARLIGDFEDVSAMGDRDDPYKNLSVGLSGSSGMTARWNVVPTGGALHGTMILHGENGKATLEIPVDGAWRLEIEQGENSDQSWPDWDAAGAVVKELDGQPAGMGSWFDACRDLEIADHVAKSLRRKRTIEIRREGNPEETTFKGIMSAGGCVLLLLCLLATLVLAVVEGLRMPLLTSPEDVVQIQDADKPRAHILWRLLPAYPLLAFLALQTLLIVAKSGRKEKPPEEPQEEPQDP